MKFWIGKGNECKRQYYISRISICKVTLNMNCSCMYIQLYAIQVKLNLMCSKTREVGCVWGVVALRMGLNTSSCRGPAHPSVAVSPFCFGPASCISAFLDERFLHPVVVFQALAKFCKPALVKFSLITWTVVKNRRAALPIMRHLMHYSSSLSKAPNLRWAGSRQ